jgi:hypothetical protein
MASAASHGVAAAAAKTGKLPPFKFRPSWQYLYTFRNHRFTDFISISDEAMSVRCLSMMYRHESSGVTVTLIPVVHVAHPVFFHAIDELCCQHESVLCEGRSPLANAPFSTIVPARDLPTDVRPSFLNKEEPWEPSDRNAFRQPFSWGVNESPKHTVVHAADLFEPDVNPMIYRLRYQIPLIGHYKREKHCLNMIPPLTDNGYKSFVIPWGAGHMPIFATMLEDNGFEQVGMTGLYAAGAIDGTYSTSLYRRHKYWTRLMTSLEGATSATAGFASFLIVAFLIVQYQVIYE